MPILLTLALALTLQAHTPAPPSAPTSQPATQREPAIPAPDLTLPRNLVAMGDYKSAERALRQALAAEPANPPAPQFADARFLLAFTLLHEDHPQAALAEYAAAAKLRPPAPADLIGEASAYLLLHNLAAAEPLLTAATTGAPRLAAGWYLLGRLHRLQNHPAEAERSFTACLHADPRHIQCQTSLGELDQQSGRAAAAEAAFRSALQWQQNLPHKDPAPSLDLGMLLLRQGHPDTALPLLQAAATLAPKDPIALRELGLAHSALGHYPQAIATLRKAIALDPRSDVLHFYLGRTLHLAGDDTQANRQFAEAARLTTLPKSAPSFPTR